MFSLLRSMAGNQTPSITQKHLHKLATADSFIRSSLSSTWPLSLVTCHLSLNSGQVTVGAASALINPIRCGGLET